TSWGMRGFAGAACPRQTTLADAVRGVDSVVVDQSRDNCETELGRRVKSIVTEADRQSVKNVDRSRILPLGCIRGGQWASAKIMPGSAEAFARRLAGTVAPMRLGRAAEVQA